MNEHLGDKPVSHIDSDGDLPNGVNQLSDEQAMEGYLLGKDEVVSLSVDRSRTRHPRASVSLRVGSHKTPVGRAIAIAEILVGGHGFGESARAVVYDLDTLRNGEKFIALYDTKGRSLDVHATLLPDEPFEIGRGNPGQEDLGDMVSGDHCAIYLGKDGQLKIENHIPTNITAVRKLT